MKLPCVVSVTGLAFLGVIALLYPTVSQFAFTVSNFEFFLHLLVTDIDKARGTKVVNQWNKISSVHVIRRWEQERKLASIIYCLIVPRTMLMTIR